MEDVCIPEWIIYTEIALDIIQRVLIGLSGIYVIYLYSYIFRNIYERKDIIFEKILDFYRSLWIVSYLQRNAEANAVENRENTTAHETDHENEPAIDNATPSPNETPQQVQNHGVRKLQKGVNNNATPSPNEKPKQVLNIDVRKLQRGVNFLRESRAKENATPSLNEAPQQVQNVGVRKLQRGVNVLRESEEQKKQEKEKTKYYNPISFHATSNCPLKFIRYTDDRFYLPLSSQSSSNTKKTIWK